MLLLAVVGALYYFALHMSLAEEIEQAERRHRTLQGELVQAEQRQQEYLAAVQELADREAIDRQNKRMLPEQAEMPSFLQDLNRLAELSGLRLRHVEPRPEEPADNYVRLPVALGLSGRHHQVAKFFYAAGRIERIINMENVALTEPVQSGDEVTLKVDVLATTFRRPTTAEAQASAGTMTGAGGAPGGAR